MYTYLSQFSFADIIEIESKDLQFVSLKNAWENILLKSENKILAKNIFLFLILQNGLISYQVAGSGEQWWEEFSEKIFYDWSLVSDLLVNKKDNLDRWYSFLIGSKYNKRIYNIKISRLLKFNIFLSHLDFYDEDFFWKYYCSMDVLLSDISRIMSKSPDSKSLTFTIKMFGYGARIVFGKLIYYPHSIKIPLDSRLKKIYEVNTGIKVLNSVGSKKLVEKYFDHLSQEFNLPPLHLDSLLWIDYWKNYIKK